MHQWWAKMQWKCMSFALQLRPKASHGLLYTLRSMYIRSGTMKPEFEFKFDDTRLASWYKNKISRIDFFLLSPDVAKSLPCWLSQFRKANWDSQKGRDLVTSGRNNQKFQSGQSHYYIMRKVKSIIKFELKLT